MGVERIRQTLKDNWQRLFLLGGLLALLAGGLFWQLGSLLPGYAPQELETYKASLSFKDIFNQPVNAPFLLLVKAVTFVVQDSLLAVRIVSTGIGLVILGVFAYLVQRWHGTKVAVISTVLFGLSAWFLHTARLGTPEVLQYGVFVLVAAGFWLKRTNHWLPLLICFILTASLLYVPGLIWFVALGIVWQWRMIDKVFKRHLLTVSLAGLIALAALVPLGLTIYKDPALALTMLGIPETWPAPLTMLKDFLLVPVELMVRNDADNPAGWLGSAPILDAFSLTMFALGILLYVKHFRLVRAPLFLLIFIVTALLMSIGAPITFTVLIPFVYIIMAAGISQLLALWFSVFPRNPIARSLGWTAITAVVLVACLFHITHYFIGWPHADKTHEVFTIQKP